LLISSSVQPSAISYQRSNEMRNVEIARLFNNIADYLEVKVENPFRIRAYRRAAQAIEGLAEDIAAIAERGTLLELPGIGKDLARKIRDIGSAARRELEVAMNKKVFLDLAVVVDEHWVERLG
jgi:DNA polymerase (family 10)